jgi:hypothetical protein
MRYLIVLSTLAIALAASSAAAAGGWATVGIAPLPEGVDAGGTWTTEITVLQHGKTPLDGLTPIVTIRDEGGEPHEFVATPTGEAGAYEASIVFPEAGSWGVVVDSGFGDSRLTYGPVAVEDGSPAGGDDRSIPTIGLVVLAACGLLVAGAFGVRHVRRLAPASR